LEVKKNVFSAFDVPAIGRDRRSSMTAIAHYSIQQYPELTVSVKIQWLGVIAVGLRSTPRRKDTVLNCGSAPGQEGGRGGHHKRGGPQGKGSLDVVDLHYVPGVDGSHGAAAAVVRPEGAGLAEALAALKRLPDHVRSAFTCSR
jgi:hypothetical protein